MELMATKARRAPRRTEALSRDVIVQAATEILDAEGEDALTLRALTVRLATGYGAIYHHVADRDDLLAAATDHVIARILTGPGGAAGQNAANARALASSKMDRSAFLAAVAERWAQLDPARYPSVHKAGTQLPEHDDREQFLAGIDLILAGIETVNRAAKDSSAR